MNGKSGIHLYVGNRLEELAGALAESIRVPLPNPFTRERIVVQSLGMERWLTQQLARRHGICANVSFLFPQRFVGALIDEALPEKANNRFYSRETLTWRIMALLPGLVRGKEFVELRRYLEGPRPELRRFQLAEKIASSFDRYLAFRPGMILDWEKGAAATDWQAILWRKLIEDAPGLHPPALAEEFKAVLRSGQARLPERVSLFGISTLPPFYLGFLEELAERTAIHLFVMRPTPHFWGDIRSEREETRARRKVRESAQLDLQFERGNPLLASLGKLGREFLEKVTELNPAREHEFFQPPDHRTALDQIQSDIFGLQDSGLTKSPIADDDPSLQLHSCHSPMREMEVLHDQLLALFEKFPDLKPHDIVVMAPDITAYAPLIEAVFDTAPKELEIPFSISDRGARAENGVIDTFLRILETSGSRFTASSVVSVLESAPLQRRFDLAEPDLEIIRTWIEETAIRWGIDAAHRESLGLPRFRENSWRAGLDRLLLGYAAPARNEKLFEGILAYDEVEGGLAETLGQFAEFAETLFTTARDLERPRSLTEWQESLREISLRFFPADDEREPELRQLRRVFDSLGEIAGLSGLTETVSLDVILAHLEQALANTESGSGFLVGRVTFCALKPMRAIPFRVVCLVGMNDTAFPRHDRAPAFDLIARQPQPGDRTTRDDDRYLFLEALLSARNVFYISYLGRSIRDNSALPPSVLVSELLDYTGATPTEHPLQPFSAKYFTGTDGLFSYSSENCLASGTAAEERTSPAPFIIEKIGEPEAEWQKLDNAKLLNFFGNPSKFLIRERLGLRIPRLDSLLEEAEPLEPGGLAKYSLEQDFLKRALAGEEVETLFAIARAGGALPPGRAGDSHLRELSVNARRFAAVVRANARNRAEPELLQLTIGRFELSALIDSLFDGRALRQRLTTRKPKDLLRTWIDHLILNCFRSTESILITATKEKQPVIERFAPPGEDPRKLLGVLLDLYWQGLREPLPFFPRSSSAFAERTVHPKKGGSTPLEKARKAWGDSALPHDDDLGRAPEREDDYFDLAFRNVPDPLGPDFQEIAITIFEPALRVMSEEEL